MEKILIVDHDNSTDVCELLYDSADILPSTSTNNASPGRLSKDDMMHLKPNGLENPSSQDKHLDNCSDPLEQSSGRDTEAGDIMARKHIGLENASAQDKPLDDCSHSISQMPVGDTEAGDSSLLNTQVAEGHNLDNNTTDSPISITGLCENIHNQNTCASDNVSISQGPDENPSKHIDIKPEVNHTHEETPGISRTTEAISSLMAAMETTKQCIDSCWWDIVEQGGIGSLTTLIEESKSTLAGIAKKFENLRAGIPVRTDVAENKRDMSVTHSQTSSRESDIPLGSTDHINTDILNTGSLMANIKQEPIDNLSYECGLGHDGSIGVGSVYIGAGNTNFPGGPVMLALTADYPQIKVEQNNEHIVFHIPQVQDEIPQGPIVKTSKAAAVKRKCPVKLQRTKLKAPKTAVKYKQTAGKPKQSMLKRKKPVAKRKPPAEKRKQPLMKGPQRVTKHKKTAVKPKHPIVKGKHPVAKGKLKVSVASKPAPSAVKRKQMEANRNGLNQITRKLVVQRGIKRKHETRVQETAGDRDTEVNRKHRRVIVKNKSVMLSSEPVVLLERCDISQYIFSKENKNLKQMDKIHPVDHTKLKSTTSSLPDDVAATNGTMEATEKDNVPSKTTTASQLKDTIPPKAQDISSQEDSGVPAGEVPSEDGSHSKQKQDESAEDTSSSPPSLGINIPPTDSRYRGHGDNICGSSSQVDSVVDTSSASQVDNGDLAGRDSDLAGRDSDLAEYDSDTVSDESYESDGEDTNDSCFEGTADPINFDDETGSNSSKEKAKVSQKSELELRISDANVSMLRTCITCKITLSDDAEMTRHMASHVSKDGQQCNICGRKGTSERKLRHHLKSHTTTLRLCPVCNTVCASRHFLRTHMRGHIEEKPYVCHVCRVSFVLASDLQDHMATHTDSSMKAHICGNCGKQFKNQITLSVHIKKKICCARDSPPRTVATFSCWTCKKGFQSEEELDTHVKTHETGEFDCVQCDVVCDSKRALLKHEELHKNTFYECAFCHKRFECADEHQNHMMTHLIMKEFGCTLCSQSFTKKKDLDEHLMDHADNLPYQCDICDQSFRHQPSLLLHMSKHTGKTSATHATCEVCHKRFTKGAVKRHMRIHTGERKFKCQLCGEAFASASPLVTHMGKCPQNTA